jgi:peptide deformylase
MPLHIGKLRYIGLAARCAQHEIDHLDGIVMTSRMGAMQRRLFLKRLEKARKKHERSG